ncbi:MAG TPA: DUF3866 family protein [Actinomycetota bacterium]|nr:DUF3866 family protein [Actinomycetota bacterium]
MIRIRRGIVRSITSSRDGAVELEVELDGASQPAVAYPDLCGPVEPGETVLLNATAVELGLGTGGVHLVIAVEGRESQGGMGPQGHVIKARYTPVQTAVASVEETHAELLERSAGLRGTPVVCAPLHSMVAPIAAGAKRAVPDLRIAYVMTDGAALPGGFSRLVAELRASALLDGWITCGQAFGGELEAVTVWSGLLAAKELVEAEAIVVADGPGNLGTETTWGVSALASGHALMAAETLGGRPIPALRMSFADRRDRHRGVSHHSLTILADVCRVDVNVPVPVLEDDGQRETVWGALRARSLEERHHLVEVDGAPAIEELRARGVQPRTMGRGIDDDPAFFLAAGAAGVLAGRMAAADRRWRSSLD